MSFSNPANPLKSSDGPDISFDNTMVTNNNGSIGVTNPNRGIMTQAEYDALPEEEKTKGTYIISDNQNGSGGVSSGTSSGEIYSEEEIVIGTWLGKPLYRKVILTTSPAAVTTTSVVVANLPEYLERCISIRGTIQTPSGALSININSIVTLVSYQNKTINMKITDAANQSSRPVYIILEYTKTTDEVSE